MQATAPHACGFATRRISEVVCRYISEVYGGLALHPVDLVDMGTGRQLAALTGAPILPLGVLVCRQH